MSPAPQRGNIPEEELFISTSTPNPTLLADQESWLNYEVAENRWYFWDGTAWRKILIVPDASVTPAADKLVLANGSGNIDPNWLALAALPIAKLANAAAAAFMRAQRTAPFAAEWQAVGTNEILARSGATSEVTGVPVSAQSLLLRKAADLVVETAAVSEWLGRGASGDLGFKAASALLTNLVNAGPMAGTSFPVSPVDGQPFYHQTHGMSYHYDATAVGWLSDHSWTFYFSALVDVTTLIYLGHGPSVQAAGEAFTDTYGPFLGFQTKVVGMRVAMAVSGTCSVQVYAGGVAVTGAVLSPAAQAKRSDELLMSNAIAADAILGVKRTSGTLEGPATGTFSLRRFET